MLSVTAVLAFATACAGELGESAEEVGASAAAITAQPDPSCSYAQSNGREYWICGAGQRWQDAKITCESVGMQLARPNALAENDWLRAQLSADAWLGGSDLAVENAWRWADDDAQFWSGGAFGSAQNDMFTRWRTGEPNDLFGEDCLIMSRWDGRWNDVPCTNTRPFVCEQTAATAGQPQAPDTECARHVREGVEYWTCTNQRSWDAARAQCQAVGMDLVEVDDAEESSFLGMHVTRESHIGLSDRENEGVWRAAQSGRLSSCGDGRTPGDAYSNWAPGQPYQANACQSVSASGKTYWLCDNRLPWAEAQAECTGSGMSLARVDSAAENALLAASATRESWLGSSDRAAEGRWVWADGAQFWSGGVFGSAVSGLYRNWQIGEPNDLYSEDCGVIDDDTGRWRDEPCDQGLYQPGFICEGDLGAEHPDGNDCAYLQLGSLAHTAGQWRSGTCEAARAYVCERPAIDAGVGLEDQVDSIREDHQLGAARVTDLQFKPDAGVTRPFLSDERRLGLRACVDTLEPASEPRLLDEDVEQIEYGQFYQGIPVFGRGYSVLRDAATSEVISATGTLAPNISADTRVQIAEREAWAQAVAAVDASPWSLLDPQPGELVLMPKTQARAPEYELSWLFQVPAASGPDSYDVAISARTGEVVLRRYSLDRQCAPVALPPAGQSTLVTEIAVTDIPQSAFGDPNTALANRSGTASDAPIALYSRGISNDPGSPVFQTPVVRAMCADATAPANLVSVPSTTVSVGQNPTAAPAAASLYLALQTCVDVFAQQFTTRAGAPWIGSDGVGLQSIDLHMYAPGTAPVPFGYSLAAQALVADAGYRPWPGASLEIACHELGHGIWHSVFGNAAGAPSARPAYGLETQAIAEGFGDILGSLAEIVIRGIEHESNFCIVGDGHPSCSRDLSFPESSLGPECNFTDPQSGAQIRSGCPSEYVGPHYCLPNVECTDAITAGCCDVHTNATVLGHWFFLLTSGDFGLDQADCQYAIEPLSPDPAESARLAAELVFAALRDGLMPARGGYEDLANATITKAAQLFPAGSGQIQSVVAAWAAVNVRENFFEGATATVRPARASRGVAPWVVFEWPVTSAQTGWDFQLGRDGFTGSDLLHEESDIRTFTGRPSDPGQGFAQFKLALPENSVGHYVWRVRPHRTGAWAQCHPIHWFDDTGAMPASAIALEPRDTAGLVEPGSVRVSWDDVPGATGYEVQVTATDTQCARGGSEISVGLPDPGDTTVATFVSGLQPESTYYAQVLAIGPEPLGGGAAPTRCFSQQFQTGSMRAPDLSEPAEGAVYDYFSPHFHYGSGENLRYHWIGFGGAARYELTFYPLTGGVCDRLMPIRHTIERPCALGTCGVIVTDDFFPLPHPGGYCWEVVTIAANGSRSPVSETRTYRYALEPVTGQVPGLYVGAIENDVAQGRTWLTNYEYGQPVTFAWNSHPGAADYVMKLGRWPWRAPRGSRDPENCMGAPNLSVCEDEPVQVTFRDAVAANGITLPGEVAGRGRYCFQVWPRMDAAVQPLLAWPQTYCYTTPPAPPTIALTEGQPLAEGFADVTIRGEITLPYLPSGTDIDIDLGPHEVSQTASPECEVTVESNPNDWTPPEAWLLGDRYDCKVSFEIDAVESTDYHLAVTLAGQGIELKDELDFQTQACGAPDERCCAMNACDAADNLRCESDFCRDCGELGEACCAHRTCEGASTVCGADTTCVGCGLAGQACCDGNTCAFGNECSGGSCRPIGPMCNSTVHQGGDAPETHRVQLGRTSGTTRFTFNTFDVGDVISLSYEGQTLESTGCLSTGVFTGSGCLINGVEQFAHPTCNVTSSLLPQGCACCSGGTCWVDVRYSGVSSEMTVAVQPNCTFGSETVWNFSLSCPQ